MTWDTYFFQICQSVAEKSPCLSRKIGAILVRDHSVVSTGYNGPPRGIPHCGAARLSHDEILTKEIHRSTPSVMTPDMIANTIKSCPRRVMQIASGEGMQWCPAQHAEENCISNAARLGVPTVGTTLYMNCILPCKNCYGTLINAGITEIVITDLDHYDKYTKYLLDNSSINIRSFNI